MNLSPPQCTGELGGSCALRLVCLLASGGQQVPVVPRELPAQTKRIEPDVAPGEHRCDTRPPDRPARSHSGPAVTAPSDPCNEP